MKKNISLKLSSCVSLHRRQFFATVVNSARESNENQGKTASTRDFVKITGRVFSAF